MSFQTFDALHVSLFKQLAVYPSRVRALRCHISADSAWQSNTANVGANDGQLHFQNQHDFRSGVMEIDNIRTSPTCPVRGATIRATCIPPALAERQASAGFMRAWQESPN
jgi:hypothetical protein